MSSDSLKQMRKLKDTEKDRIKQYGGDKKTLDEIIPKLEKE